MKYNTIRDLYEYVIYENKYTNSIDQKKIEYSYELYNPFKKYHLPKKEDKIINQLSEIMRRIERIELYLINH